MNARPAAPSRRSAPARQDQVRGIDQLNEQAARCLRLDPQQACALATQAVEQARAVGYARGLCVGLRWLGNGHILAGAYPLALPLFIEALELARRLRLREAEVACANGVGVALLRLGEFDGALEHLQAALQLIDAADQPFSRMTTFGNLANVCAELGQMERAVEYAQRAVALMQDMAGGDEQARMPRVNLGAYLARLGRASEAIEHLRIACVLMERSGDRAGEARARAVLAETLLDLGRTAEALPLATCAAEQAQAAGARQTQAQALLCLARAHQDLGSGAAAVEACRQALALASASGEVRLQRQAHARLALLHEAEADLPRALHHLREAHRLECDHYRAVSEQRAQALLVRMRVAEAQREAHMQRVRNLELMEANRRLATAQPRRSAPHGAPPDAGLHGLTGVKSYDLSGREVRILELLGRGQTNAQIARSLELSPYTVRDHVSAILAKLGVASRTEAAATAARNGWL